MFMQNISAPFAGAAFPPPETAVVPSLDLGARIPANVYSAFSEVDETGSGPPVERASGAPCISSGAPCVRSHRGGDAPAAFFSGRESHIIQEGIYEYAAGYI